MSSAKPDRPTPVFVNRMRDVEQALAVLLARVAHFMHRDVVEAVRKGNESYAADFAEYAPEEVCGGHYLYASSDCGFPGVHRQSGQSRSPQDRRRYVSSACAILDDNVFPRHIWAFLASGNAYSGAGWKASGLDTFELAHLFPHKPEESGTINTIWPSFEVNHLAMSLFTSVSSVILVPKGLAKPTDVRGPLLACFYQRYLELYGGPPLPHVRGDGLDVPGWYPALEWQAPILPQGWATRVANFLDYRHRRLRAIFGRAAKAGVG